MRRRERSLSLREREIELERRRQRLRLLEEEIGRERSGASLGINTRPVAAEISRRPSSRKSRSVERRAPTEHTRKRSRSRLPTDPEVTKECQAKRSCTPSFSLNDVIKIVQSVKNVTQPNQSVTQLAKNIDHKNILPNFDPSVKSQRVDIWLRKVNECATVYGWDEITTIHFSMQKLQGLAKVWYESLKTIKYTWDQWQENLKSAFPCEQNYGQILEEMLKRKSRVGEPIENYYYEKLALLNQCDITDKHAVDCIVHGLGDRTMKSSALALCCSQPEQLLQFLISHKESQPVDRFHNNRNRFGTDNASNYQNNKSNNRFSRNQSVVFCFNCKERGHPYTKCLKPIIRCTKCSRVGHRSEECKNKTPSLDSKHEPAKTMCIFNSNPNAKFVKPVDINNKVVDGFIDFGSEVTLVRLSLITNLGLQHDNVPTLMKGFGNNAVQSIGTISLEISVDGVPARVACRVVDDNLLDTPILIGQSYTEQPHITVYKDSTRLQFHAISLELPGVDTTEDCKVLTLRLKSDVNLHGLATVTVCTGSNIDCLLLLNNSIIGPPDKEVAVTGGVYQVKNGQLDISIYPCSKPQFLKRKMVLARGEKVEFVRRLVMESPGISSTTGRLETGANCNISLDEVKVGDLATQEEKHRLIEILHTFKHLFASSLKDLGCTDVTQMNIELNSTKPIVYRPYRLAHHERDKVQTMVSEMLEANIIRESVSDYASPVILVRKKDGNMRMCVDYRMLNSVTVKEIYPMPIIEDEIARLSGQSCFITLDLASGYYQVPISESAKHLTAFVTPDGLYEFNRMPFGLANAPAVFQRLINRVLGTVRFTKATAYMDDVLIYGDSASQCLDRLEDILSLLEKANLTLNLTKCEFLRSNIDYLGYEISAAGVRPGQKKILSVSNFPRPINVHCVRQFIGLASYFRKFIQNFAVLALPLTQLLAKDTTWQWGQAQENAFEVLKSKLVDRPTLAFYDREAETELHTDASKDGIGGILLQRDKQTGQYRPIAYYSRKTSPEERFYHSYELETLAVVKSLEKFRVYLLGKEFRIVSDCSALRSTFIKRDLIPRIARWWLLLQEFNCTIEYRPGTKMSHVDALSRNPIESETEISNNVSMVMVINEDDWLHTLQLGDSELNRIRKILEDDLDSKGLQYIKDNYLIRDNKLYRYIKGDKENLRWVVPKGARWQICRLNHDEIGHMGQEKTLERIKKHYWFTKINRFVKKYINACIECAYAKKGGKNNEGLLHPIEKVALPFHTLHVDHLGPFVRSKRGNSYLLVVVDAFTKFIFIKPVRNTKTENVIRALDDIFYTFRMPDRLISDRGSCFTSNTFKRYCYDKGIKQILNAVASPKSNGQVERYNRTILNSLKAQNLKFDERDWDTQTGKVQWGLNNTVQKTTGRRPAEVMFGTCMAGEINPALNELTNLTNEDIDVDSIRTEVKDKIDAEQIKQKQLYDQNRRPAQIYNEGDLVKISKVSFNNDGKSKKLLPSYIGPFRITKVLGQDRYKVASIPGFNNQTSKRTTTVAADRILPWVHVAALQLNDSDSSENESDPNVRDEDST